MAIFISVVALIFWLIFFYAWKLRHASHKREDTLEALLREEREADAVRRKEIDKELFFIPDLSALPAPEDGGLLPAAVLFRAGCPMLRLPHPMTNLELKRAYGVAQLTVIAQYEENFNTFLSALIAWAESLAAGGRNTDAIRILTYTVTIGSEYSKSYKLLADLYAETYDMEGLSALAAAAETQAFKDENLRRTITAYINRKRNEAKP